MNAIHKILPLILAVSPCAAVAAQDAKIIESNKQYVATMYGLSLTSKPAMSLVLKVGALDDSGLSQLAVTSGESGATALLVAGFDAVRMPADPTGVGGWLLVAPMLTAKFALDGNGEFHSKFDLGDPKFDGLVIRMQAVSLQKNGTGYELHLSNGLELAFAK